MWMSGWGPFVTPARAAGATGSALSVLGGNRLGQRGAPGGSVERVGEVLGLVRHVAVG